MRTTMSDPSSADREIAAVADRLKELKSALGATYWRDDEVRALQEKLRKQIGAYGAWGEDKLGSSTFQVDWKRSPRGAAMR